MNSKATGSSSLPIDDNENASWDGGAAVAAIKDWASSDGNINFSKYGRGFAWHDSSGGDKQSN